MSRIKILLDMDGTITEPRGKVKPDMVKFLGEISVYADIFVVSGSDINYLHEQCGDAFVRAGIAQRITLMPCNGTKVYRYSLSAGDYDSDFGICMKRELGVKRYKNLLDAASQVQRFISEKYGLKEIGEVFSERKTMINWCLIGRGYSSRAREDFAIRPDNEAIRLEAIKKLKEILSYTLGKRIDCALGGQTSIDIYPAGWDKTFSLTHFNEDDEVWFIGDKCGPNQNDFHIFQRLHEDGKAFSTTGPENTKVIIADIVEDIVEDVVGDIVRQEGVSFIPEITNQTTFRERVYKIIATIKAYWSNLLRGLS